LSKINCGQRDCSFSSKRLIILVKELKQLLAQINFSGSGFPFWPNFVDFFKFIWQVILKMHQG